MRLLWWQQRHGCFFDPGGMYSHCVQRAGLLNRNPRASMQVVLLCLHTAERPGNGWPSQQGGCVSILAQCQVVSDSILSPLAILKPQHVHRRSMAWHALCSMICTYPTTRVSCFGVRDSSPLPLSAGHAAGVPPRRCYPQ